MTVKSFVDTNILLYSRDSVGPEKQRIASTLLEQLWEKKLGRLSTQVLNEYFVNVTQKLKPGLSKETAWEDVSLYKEWDPMPIDMLLLERSYTVQKKYGLSWWDSLIVGAASRSGCEIIYSEDLSHEQMYFGIQVINPFHNKPETTP